jgi:alpha/beta superfamily hydrolase
MSPATERRSLAGAAGRIELAIDWPAAAPAGLAFIAHPHPLYGGTMDNKVVTTLVKASTMLGWLAVRLNFRGVGASEGQHDAGHGETEDFLHLVESLPGLPGVAERLPANLPLAYAGFSFGSFVVAQAAQRRAPRHLVLVGCAAGKWAMPAVPAGTLVIHGELDETIPLADVFDWARPQQLSVTVMPGADHFFHRRLGELRRLVTLGVRGKDAIDASPASP